MDTENDRYDVLNILGIKDLPHDTCQTCHTVMTTEEISRTGKASAICEKCQINALTENGGKLWEKNGMRRIYFNAEIVLNLDIERYNTGNICSATLDNIKISNSETSRCLDLKFWYDLVDGKFHWKNADRLHAVATTTISEFVAKMRALIS